VQKNLPRSARNVKEISREIDRATREENFNTIAGSRKSALGAMFSDRNFFCFDAIRSQDRALRSIRSKKIFPHIEIAK
jgi:hypothetical protein